MCNPSYSSTAKTVRACQRFCQFGWHAGSCAEGTVTFNYRYLRDQDADHSPRIEPT